MEARNLSKMIMCLLPSRWRKVHLAVIISTLFFAVAVVCFYEASSKLEYAKKLNRRKTQISGLYGTIQRMEPSTREPWKSRLDALQRGCTSGLNGCKLNTTHVTTRFYSSSRLGFSVCKVPKAGSTLWTILFLILENEESPEEVFAFPRNKLHKKGDSYIVHRPPDDSKLNVIVSRDPYARLFSAYIDKIFLLGKLSGNFNTDSTDKYVVRNFICGYNTTFSAFLDYILPSAKGNGKHTNWHWVPVYLLCDACNIRYQEVLHTETLSSDSEYIIDKLLVPKSQKMALKNSLHRDEGNKTLVGLLEDILHPINTKRKMCPDRPAYLYKLWQSLQTQGYLHIQSAFPWDFFKDENNLEDSSIINLIFDTMAKQPLSKEERESQRRAALVSAYKDVGRETIKRIQKMFMMDFRLFGYDINPPS